MYHCHLRLYLVGRRRELLGQIRNVPPLPPFTHEFLESEEPDVSLAAQAGVILADLDGMDAAAAVSALAAGKKAETPLILLADREQIDAVTDLLADVQDIWTTPMSPAELAFRFRRWQEGFKAEKDAWETRQFLEITINSTPSLIWYKTRDGIHE